MLILINMNQETLALLNLVNQTIGKAVVKSWRRKVLHEKMAHTFAERDSGVLHRETTWLLLCIKLARALFSHAQLYQETDSICGITLRRLSSEILVLRLKVQ